MSHKDSAVVASSTPETCEGRQTHLLRQATTSAGLKLKSLVAPSRRKAAVRRVG